MQVAIPVKPLCLSVGLFEGEMSQVRWNRKKVAKQIGFAYRLVRSHQDQNCAEWSLKLQRKMK